MRLWEVFRFEVAYWLRRSSAWVYVSLFVVLALLMTSMLIDDARRNDLVVNAPSSVTFAILLTGWLGMLAAAAFCGDAAVRDVQSRTATLFYTTAVSRTAYLGGRFLGTLVMTTLVLAVVPVVFALAAQTPLVAAEFVGPLGPMAYVQPFLVFGLPNAVVTAALLFAAAALSRRVLASYVVGLVLFLLSFVGEEVVAESLGRNTLGSLLDPFGFVVASEVTTHWTVAERQTQFVELEGLLLWNRLLWLGIGLVALVIAILRFRFAPALGDLDADGAPDLLVGTWNDGVAFYRNESHSDAAHFALVDSSLVELTRGSHSTPALADLDGDGDLDLLVGETSGTINFYRNAGSPEAPRFELVSDEYEGIDVGRRSVPALVDLDSDGDFDLVIGSEGDGLVYYRNMGSPQQPAFTRDASLALSAPVLATPAFADLDGDGDPDLVVGGQAGGIEYHENNGSEQ